MPTKTKKPTKATPKPTKKTEIQLLREELVASKRQNTIVSLLKTSIATIVLCTAVSPVFWYAPLKCKLDEYLQTQEAKRKQFILDRAAENKALADKYKIEQQHINFETNKRLFEKEKAHSLDLSFEKKQLQYQSSHAKRTYRDKLEIDREYGAKFDVNASLRRVMDGLGERFISDVLYINISDLTEKGGLLKTYQKNNKWRYASITTAGFAVLYLLLNLSNKK